MVHFFYSSVILPLGKYTNVAIIVSARKFNSKIRLFVPLAISANGTLRAEDIVNNEVTPSEWGHRSLTAFNYLWQASCSFQEEFRT